MKEFCPFGKDLRLYKTGWSTFSPWDLSPNTWNDSSVLVYYFVKKNPIQNILAWNF